MNVFRSFLSSAEPATVKKAGRAVGKEPATKARGRQAKESESEAEEDKPNQKSEDEAEEEEEEEESEEEYTPKKKKKPEQAERRPATASSGNRKGSRSSRQNRGLMQKISLGKWWLTSATVVKAGASLILKIKACLGGIFN